jgi:hypothetical protein
MSLMRAELDNLRGSWVLLIIVGLVAKIEAPF